MTGADKTLQDKPGSIQAEEGAGDTSYFGFQSVPRERHRGLVGQVFRRVAGRYDLMNDLMSLGLHRLWKRAMIDWFNPRRGGCYLDMAGGTGDIAHLIFKKCAGRCDIVLADINETMLGAGRRRNVEAGFSDSTALLCANAESLAFPDKQFDGYTVAFGIRNVTNISQALEEAYRVLKPGGRFMCLEFSSVDIPGLDQLYDFYSFQAIPRLGKVITGDAEAYRYLVESIRQFPDQEEFARMISKAGFSNVHFRNLSGGVVALHSAWRL